MNAKTRSPDGAAGAIREPVHPRFPHAALLLAAALFTGCVPGHTVKPGSGYAQRGADIPYRVLPVTPEVLIELQQQQRRRLRTERDPDLHSLAEVRDEYHYRLGPGDIVNVVVWEHPELTNPGNELRTEEAAGRLIDAGGYMFFPYVGAFRAEGMRLVDLRSHITENLRRVIRNPQVDVRVIAHRSQRVFVTGEVAVPGVVNLDDVPRGVLDVINETGGLTERASRRTAVISRNGSSFPVNLYGLYASGLPEHNIALRPGDVVHVPDNSAEKVFVMGDARETGAVQMGRHAMTLTEALASAGGLQQQTSNDSGIFVFRSGAWHDGSMYDGERIQQDEALVFALDLSRVDGFLMAERFELMPRDVVYVQSTRFARYNRVIQQLLPTITAVFQIDRLTD